MPSGKLGADSANDNPPSDTDGLVNLLSIYLARFKREPETRHLSAGHLARTAEALRKLHGGA